MNAYVLEGCKTYVGKTCMGIFATHELAENAKTLAEKIISKHEFDCLIIEKIVVHNEIPGWKTWLKRKFALK